MRYKADSLSGEGNVCDYFVDKFGAEFKSKGYADEREGGWVRRERERREVVECDERETGEAKKRWREARMTE